MALPDDADRPEIFWRCAFGTLGVVVLTAGLSMVAGGVYTGYRRHNDAPGLTEPVWFDVILVGIFAINLGCIYLHSRVVASRWSDVWGRLTHTVSQTLMCTAFIALLRFLSYATRDRPVESPPVDKAGLYVAFGLFFAGMVFGLIGTRLSEISPLITPTMTGKG